MKKTIRFLTVVGLAAFLAIPARSTLITQRRGWPAEKTVWLPAGAVCPAGMFEQRMATCCGSMRPAIFGGERAFWQKYDGKSKLAGFVVWTPAFTHRVIAETDAAVLTEGDNNARNDGWTPKWKIVAVLRFVVRS